MARDPLPHQQQLFVGDAIHGQSQATLMKMHQQSLERTIQSSLTLIHNESTSESPDHQQQQRLHNKKKKKYYPWVQRDSQNQRNKIGQEGSKRRQRHDNDKFLHHPFAVLYQVDLAFPGYGHEAPSFHWKYDAMVENLIRNNPPSSRRSKAVVDGAASEPQSEESQQPLIGHRLLTRAQRKDIKKVHVPQGIVMQYEGELVNFLDQLTLSESESESESEDEHDANQQTEVSDELLATANDTVEKDANWVLVNKPEETTVAAQIAAAPVAEEQVTADSNPTTSFTVDSEERVTDEGLREPVSNNSDPSAVVAVNDESDPMQIYLRWDIQDQFLRFVAHALCAFYGLVSFSKTAKDGKRWLYVCHPAHLDSIGQLATPNASTQSSPMPESTPTMAPSNVATTRLAPPKRQKTLEQVQELPVHVLDQLWSQVEPVKVALTMCPRPDMTFFEYLYPSTRPMC